MRSLPPALAARRSARVATHAEILLWVAARDRSNGQATPMGVWTGIDHQIFTINGDERTYFGAGAILEVPDIETATGLEVWTYEVKLSGLAPEVEQLVRGYDTRFVPAAIHRAEFDGDGNLLAPPERRFKGWVDGAPIVTPAIGGTATITLKLVSSARALTRFGAGTKSDQSQQRRQADRFRRYSAVTPAVDSGRNWGGKS